MATNRRTYLATIGTSLGGITLAGCTEDDGDTGGGDGGSGGGDGGSGGGDGGSGGGNGGSNDEPDVELLDHEFYQEEFSAGVRGTARNNTDRELSYVEAEAVFLDEDGTQIEDGLDNVNDLAAGREWEFDCMYLGDDPGRVAEYEIEVSSGF